MTEQNDPTSPGLGVTEAELASHSILKLRKETFLAFASDVDYLVASVDPDTLSAGDSLTIAATGLSKLLPQADLLLFTVTDASGTGASVTIKIEGTRMGVKRIEHLTVTDAAGGGTTGNSTHTYDEVTAVTVTAVSGTASGDSMTLGTSGTAIGLRAGRVANTDDVKLIQYTDASSSDARVVVAPSSTTVNVAENAIITLTQAAGDIYEVWFYADGAEDGFGPNGVLASSPTGT